MPYKIKLAVELSNKAKEIGCIVRLAYSQYVVFSEGTEVYCSSNPFQVERFVEGIRYRLESAMEDHQQKKLA